MIAVAQKKTKRFAGRFVCLTRRYEADFSTVHYLKIQGQIGKPKVTYRIVAAV